MVAMRRRLPRRPSTRNDFRRSSPVLFLLKVVGWLIAHSPEGGLRLLAAMLGDLMYFALPRRRRVIDSNLHHAFPSRADRWRREIGRESCRRMVETGLLSLAIPFLSEQRLREIVTLEGIGTAENPSPLQRAFIEEQAAQCGYCTSGIIMTAYALLKKNPHPDDAEIRAALDGNICRCGTFQQVREAIHAAAKA